MPASCAATTDPAPCGQPAVITTPVALCELHRLEVALATVPASIGHALGLLREVGTLLATAPAEPAEDAPDSNDITPEEARHRLLNVLSRLQSDGITHVGPRNVLPGNRGVLGRSRPWISQQMSELADQGVLLRTETPGVYTFGTLMEGGRP